MVIHSFSIFFCAADGFSLILTDFNRAVGITSFAHLSARVDVDNWKEVFCEFLFAAFVAVIVKNCDFATGFDNDGFNEFKPETTQSVPMGNNNFSDSSL